MLNKRSREMGTYMLLGIEQEKVANLYLYENIAVGLVAQKGYLVFVSVTGF